MGTKNDTLQDRWQVAVLGQRTHGFEYPDIDHRGSMDIHYLRLDDEPTLGDFDISILDYQAFNYPAGYGGSGLWGVKKDAHNRRQQEIIYALRRGRTICFLFHDVPVPELSTSESDMNWANWRLHRETFIGFYFLSHFKLKIKHSGMRLPLMTARRTEFRQFVERYGATYNVFETFGEIEGLDRLCESGEHLTGFSVPGLRGRLIFLPCYNPQVSPKQIYQLFADLAESIIAYLSRVRAESPDWLGEFYFSKEQPIAQEITTLAESLAQARKRKEPYEERKTILFLHDYELEPAVPQFLRFLGLQVERDEKYEEDFWILEEDQRVVIGETKSYNHNLKRGGIFNLYNHREAYELPKDFPALLVANTFVTAKSLQDKLHPIEPSERREAARNNILIMRTLDMAYIFDLVDRGELTRETFLDVLLTQNGWLRVTSKGYKVLRR